jgi:hypothetical protein
MDIDSNPSTAADAPADRGCPVWTAARPPAIPEKKKPQIDRPANNALDWRPEKFKRYQVHEQMHPANMYEL